MSRKVGGASAQDDGRSSALVGWCAWLDLSLDDRIMRLRRVNSLSGARQTKTRRCRRVDNSLTTKSAVIDLGRGGLG